MVGNKCPGCGSENNQERDMFCGNCGRRLRQSPSTGGYAGKTRVEAPTVTSSDGSAAIGEPSAPMSRVGSTSGLVVFFLGVALLIATFGVALLAFLNTDRLEDFGNLITGSEGGCENALKGIGYAVAVGLLLVMGWVGGRMALFGIKMFKTQP